MSDNDIPRLSDARRAVEMKALSERFMAIAEARQEDGSVDGRSSWDNAAKMLLEYAARQIRGVK